MSRIVGLVGHSSTGQLEPWLGAMLTAASGRPQWRQSRLLSGAALLGWCGWRTPKVARESDLIAVLDGQIYNRAELPAADSDATRVAALYRRHGMEGALRQLNGDFAVALYDVQTDELWLARDRFGVRPLYYARTAEGLAFASRPRALLLLPGVAHEPNHRFVALFAASHYRTIDNDPHASPYADVAQLPASHLLRYASGTLQISRYWDLEERPELDEPEEMLAARYRELILDAVRLRLAASERPGFTLSGGLDSSSVLASAVHLTGRPQEALSTVYEDATYDETREIYDMLDACVSRWHAVRVAAPEVFSLLEEMIELHDEPVATATWLSHYLLCQQAGRVGFRGLFGGLGGDELNAGEYEYFIPYFADLLAAGDRVSYQREVQQWAEHHDHPVFRKSPEVARREVSRLVDLSQPGRCLPDLDRVQRYARALDRDYFDLQHFVPAMDDTFTSYLNNRSYQDLYRETMPCCLRAEDRHVLALELDHFLPFLDHRLAEFMYRVPTQMKIRHGVTKRLLRLAMRGILPEATRKRVKKTGWNAPAHRWFRGPGKEALLDLVQSRAFRERGIYDVGEVRRIIEEHDLIVSEGKPEDSHMMFLWQLVSLEVWLREVDKLNELPVQPSCGNRY